MTDASARSRVIDPELLIHRDATALAHAVAARFVTALVDAQSNGRVAQVVLTGGRVGIGIKSSSITHLIVCLVANFSKSTSGWFPIRCGLPARV